MGKTVALDPDPAFEGHDLPRGAGSTKTEKRKAVIPDPRNDENLAVAQTHLAMIRFHNRIVDTLPASVPAAQRFAKARELAVKHYQWMLRHDYLPRICERVDRRRRVLQRPQGVRGRRDADRRADDADRVLRRRVPARARDDPAGVQLEQAVPGRAGRAVLPVRLLRHERDARRLPAAAEQLDRRLPPAVRLQGRGGQENLARARRAQLRDADRHACSQPARFLPQGLVRRQGRGRGDDRAPTSRSATSRARRWSSSRPARRWPRTCKSKGVDGDDADQGADPQRQRRRQARRADRRRSATALATNTPLWFYVLREAELNDGKLKRRRRADRRRDVPPRDGGERALDRARHRRSGRRSGRTPTRSAWSTCCCSRSRARSRSLAPLG